MAKKKIYAKRPQPPKAHMDLPKLVEKFGTEDKCHEYLEALRWPEGVRCPRCGCKSISRIEKRRQFECNEESCRYQFSVRVGTIFDRSHLPLWKWFMAIYLVGESKKGISAKQLQRVLGVAYKTAWFLGHRIRAAMEEDAPVPLSGVVEIDETFLGGRRTGEGPWSNKVMILGAIQRGGDVRLRVQSGPNRKKRTELHRFVEDHVADEATAIHTDSAAAWGDLSDHNTAHHKVDHSSEEWVRAQVHTNTVEGVWSLLKRSVVGTYHQLSAKHLPAYLDEIAFRFNNRENPWLFRDTVYRLLAEEPLRYDALVHG
jgi:transposase-like protein